MEKLKLTGISLGIFFIVYFILGFIAPSSDGMAAESTPELKVERKIDQNAIQEGLQETLGMPILKGDVWEKMTNDSKTAFIWGFGHVVSIEQHLMEKFPELKRDSFVSKVVEGMADMPMEKVIAQVDNYYKANPAQIETPVTSVIWDLMIKPNINMGIAGRSLKI
jgi:hypothetical protein